MKKILIDKESLKNCIKQNMLLKDMAKNFGCSVGVIKRNLLYYNIVYKPASWKKNKEMLDLRKNPEIDKQWLINNWINTDKSLATIANEVGISDSLLEYRAKVYGLKKVRKHKINTEKLFDLNDPHIWYVAGLVATDGYLPKNTDCVALELVGESELNLLNDICEYYEMSTKPSYHKHSNSNYIRLSYPNIKEFFENSFNISSRDKTFTVDTPNHFPNKLCAIAYLRGCIDGDGCIENKKHRLRIVTASEVFIKGLIDIFKDYMNIDASYFVTRNKYPGLLIGKCSDFEKLLKTNNELHNCFELKRKWNF